MTFRIMAILILWVVLFWGCAKKENGQSVPEDEVIYKYSDLKLTCPEFKNGEGIPEKYTCMGENISPPLIISGVPGEARSLALIFDDPDAPGGTFVHWMLFNIPPDLEQLGVDFENTNEATQLMIEPAHLYIGPCPPLGETHRYYFRLYALDTLFNFGDSSSITIKSRPLQSEMQHHILAEAIYIGRFSRNKLIIF